MHEIWEIALQDSHHAFLVIGECVRCQLARVASIDNAEVGFLECVICVPAEHFLLTFVAEEYGRTVVRADDDLFLWLNSDG